MSEVFGRWLMAAWLGLWAAGCLYVGRWLVESALGLMRAQWNISGVAVMLVAFVVVILALRLMVPVAELLLGRTSPRLARRDFRDSIANMLFFVRSGGMWKEP